MTNKTILALVTALALTTPLAANIAYAQTSQPAAVLTVTNANIKQVFQTETAILVVTGKCATCDGLVQKLTAAAGKNNVKLGVANADEVDVPAEALPIVIVNVAGAGQIFHAEKFATPADIDAFVAARVASINKVQPALAKVKDLLGKIKDQGQTFDDHLSQLQAKLDEARKGLETEQKAINARAEADPNLKSLNDAADAIQAKIDAPFNAAIADINKRGTAAVAQIVADHKKAKADLDALDAKGVKHNDAGYKALVARIDALEADYGKAVKPFQAEGDAAEKARDASPLNADLQAAQAKAVAAAKPYEDELAAAQAKLDATFEALRTQAQPIIAAKKAALGTLPADLSTAKQELALSVKAERQSQN